MTTSRWSRASRAIVLAVAALFATTSAGCFGRFRAVHAVYDLNREATDNQVIRSLLQAALIIIPVYVVAALVDILVLHVLDFANGTNQVATETLPDGSQLHMAKVDEDTVRLRHVDRQGHETSFDVVRRADGRFAPRAQR
jgi:hypothetical protein